jgi:hypothetical protein
MTNFLSDAESDALSAIIIVSFCSSLRWVEMTQTLEITFPNGRQEKLFLGDKRDVRQVIEQAAHLRGLPIPVY